MTKKNTQLLQTTLFIVSLCLSMIVSQEVQAQLSKHPSVWYIANKKLDFRTTPVTVSSLPSNRQSRDFSNVICNQAGEVAFYISKSGEIFTDDDVIIPGTETHLGVEMIVPVPQQDEKYCIFRRADYAMLDLEKKELSSYSRLFATDAIVAMGAVHHSDCSSVWVVFPDNTTNELKAFLLTSSGVLGKPIVSPLPKDVLPGITNDLCFSPTGKLIALSRARGNVLLGEFDRETGSVSFPLPEIKLFSKTGHAVAFSPNEKLLYTAGITGSTYQIKQSEITSDLNLKDHYLVGQFVFGLLFPQRLQLGLDGRIYHRYIGQDVRVINEANTKGAGCGYIGNWLKVSSSCYPPRCVATWFSEDFCPLSIVHSGQCLDEYVDFKANQTDRINAVFWYFGDGQISTDTNPKHTYAKAGNYTVKLTVFYSNSTTETTTKEITIQTKPSTSVIHYDK